ncbi:Protein CBG09258 [Caenorhabditis briggsae]|uniref:Uncharacterized protein n=2 Tax=Caenorhabditis briggsae TaxID=6238 RepID=A0AAE9A1J4_CAEBR|nr:Protein CBG09258 [Caenorhabditis briggsae]ULT90151.1 hypothetical protein L3Y34_008490 [Caenorhabditis briggsae]CAP29296.2 Protein CBG09258 [Caenorhabditis briggsae]
MIQALLLLASVLGASVYYWQHNKEWSYVQTLDGIDRGEIILPNYNVHPILYNECVWPILDPYEPDIVKYLKNRKRRLACRPSQDVEVEWLDSKIQITFKSDAPISCVASDLSGFSDSDDVFVSPAIKLEADLPLEIPYTNFAVECEQNGKRVYRKSFYNYKKDQASKEFEAMESTPTSPSIAVLYLRSMSHSQLQREFPKIVKSTRRFGFYSFPMFNKISDNITDLVNRTFWHDEVKHTVGQYMKNERYCKVFSNTNLSGIQSDYDLSNFGHSLKSDTCSDDDSVAQRLIEQWAQFSIQNPDHCYLSHIFVNNTIWSKSLDDTLSAVLEQFQLNEVFKKTLVVVVSAEGIPVGTFGNSYTGKVEERNPILLAHIPDKLKKLYNDHMFHLESNQNRLITHLEVFDLINSFARLSKDQAIVPVRDNFMDWKREHVRGISPWQTLIPHNRTCYHVPIEDEYCLCMENKIDIEKEYNQTYAIASRLYERMESDILSNYTCMKETTWIEERNYTAVYNLNEKVLNGTDPYTEFLYFGVRAYPKKFNTRNNRKNFFVNVMGLFKHDKDDQYNFEKTYPYVTDTLKSGCLAGYMERFCEMCHGPNFLTS